eukprot:1385772-Amphidinium_carterae.1
MRCNLVSCAVLRVPVSSSDRQAHSDDPARPKRQSLQPICPKIHKKKTPHNPEQVVPCMCTSQKRTATCAAVRGAAATVSLIISSSERQWPNAAHTNIQVDVISNSVHGSITS